MEFSYDVYHRVDFVVPLIGAIASSALLVTAIVSQFREIMHGKITFETLMFIFAAIAVGGFLMVPDIRVLVQGGIYLCVEKESDAITAHVVIDSIDQYDAYDNHKYGGSDGTGSAFGVKITSGNNYYNAITSGNLKPGDAVIITYLPKSRVVLRIDKAP